MNVTLSENNNKDVGKPLIYFMLILMSLLFTTLLYVNFIVPTLGKKNIDLGIYFPLIGLGNMLMHGLLATWLMKK